MHPHADGFIQNWTDYDLHLSEPWLGIGSNSVAGPVIEIVTVPPSCRDRRTHILLTNILSLNKHQYHRICPLTQIILVTFFCYENKSNVICIRLYFMEHSVGNRKGNVKRMKSWKNRTWHFTSVPLLSPCSEKFGDCPGICLQKLLRHFFKLSRKKHQFHRS
jgi:hypothetical protein